MYLHKVNIKLKSVDETIQYCDSYFKKVDNVIEVFHTEFSDDYTQLIAALNMDAVDYVYASMEAIDNDNERVPYNTFGGNEDD